MAKVLKDLQFLCSSFAYDVYSCAVFPFCNELAGPCACLSFQGLGGDVGNLLVFSCGACQSRGVPVSLFWRHLLEMLAHAQLNLLHDSLATHINPVAGLWTSASREQEAKYFAPAKQTRHQLQAKGK